jgi:DNA helicase-2/ATP-dependent DNA helicase PcrA
VPSRFLREIPSAVLQEVRPRVQVSRPAYNTGARYASAVDLPAIRLGQRVKHAQFGEGTVVDSEGAGAHARVQVNFEEAGSKWLVMAYANLQSI